MPGSLLKARRVSLALAAATVCVVSAGSQAAEVASSTVRLRGSVADRTNVPQKEVVEAALTSLLDGPGARGAATLLLSELSTNGGELAPMAEVVPKTKAKPGAEASGNDTAKIQEAPSGVPSVLDDGSCADKEECLLLVDDFVRGMPQQEHDPVRSLMQTFGHTPAGGGGPCGSMCYLVPTCVEAHRCKFYVYDNAVAAIYLTARGKIDEARKLVEGLTSMLYPQPKDLKLLYSAYGAQGEVLDWSIDTGNNAWVGMALTHFSAATGEACFSNMARDILKALAAEVGCNDQLGGFMGRLPRGRGYYRATEHNIDMYAFARMLGETELMNQAGRFVSQMYGFDSRFPTVYATGTAGGYDCDLRTDPYSPVAADTQFWNLLSNADPHPDRKEASLNYVLRPSEDGGLLHEDNDILGDGAKLTGIRFTTKGHGAQWENTASAVMGIGYYNTVYANRSIAGAGADALAQMHSSLLHQLAEYKAVLASVKGGNLHAWHTGNHWWEYPGGSDTGIGWTYLRYPHTAATTWTGLMILETNPFAPPVDAVPAADSPVDGSCPAR